MSKKENLIKLQKCEENISYKYNKYFRYSRLLKDSDFELKELRYKTHHGHT